MALLELIDEHEGLNIPFPFFFCFPLEFCTSPYLGATEGLEAKPYTLKPPILKLALFELSAKRAPSWSNNAGD